MNYRTNKKVEKQEVEIDAELEQFIEYFNKIVEKNFLSYREEVKNYAFEHYNKVHEIMKELEANSSEMHKLGFNVYLYSEELANEYDFTHSQGFVNEYKIDGVQIDAFKDEYRNYFKDYMQEQKIYNRADEINEYESEIAKIERGLFKFTKKNQEKIINLKSKINFLKIKQREYERLDKLSTSYDKMDKNGKDTFAQFMKLKRSLFNEDNEYSFASGKLGRMRNIYQFFRSSMNQDEVKKILNASWAEVPQEEKNMIIEKMKKINNRSDYKDGEVLNMISSVMM